ncbi:hypothetical protein OUZ56_027969 [Daphnia magna]|uniref:Uncharacterized protein n=1 Tax=Daphnia magna TaxID=35525 RepID=A0ABR0B2G5_9CRUS|nr:hypothetical protein OUZ56_027969 [Daphnia magna]
MLLNPISRILDQYSATKRLPVKRRVDSQAIDVRTPGNSSSSDKRTPNPVTHGFAYLLQLKDRMLQACVFYVKHTSVIICYGFVAQLPVSGYGSRRSVVTVKDRDKTVMTVERTREENRDDPELQNENRVYVATSLKMSLVYTSATAPTLRQLRYH